MISDKLRMIIADRDEAMEALNNFSKNRSVLEEANFNAAQIDAVYKERLDAFNKANEKFYDALSLLLQIFDIEKGQFPRADEYVYVYDEYDFEWIRAQIGERAYGGALRFHKGLQILGAPNNFDRYTRWTRMPVLDDKE